MAVVTTNCEKSAEAIVDMTNIEGLNNVTVRSKCMSHGMSDSRKGETYMSRYCVAYDKYMGTERRKHARQ